MLDVISKSCTYAGASLITGTVLGGAVGFGISVPLNVALVILNRACGEQNDKREQLQSVELAGKMTFGYALYGAKVGLYAAPFFVVAGLGLNFCLSAK